MLGADTASTPPRRRSRITRGTKLLPSVHEQSVWARIMRDIYDAVLAHLGGADRVTELQRLQARRIATLEAELVHIEDLIASTRLEGKQPDPAILDLYGRLANGQRRHCQVLGWQRVQEITPDLGSYLRDKARVVTLEADPPAGPSEGNPSESTGTVIETLTPSLFGEGE